MITNRILEILTGIFSFVIIPVAIVTTLIFSLLISISFGLLLIPISLIWIVFFLGPLLSLSYVYEKVGFLRIPVSIIGIPIAVLGYLFSALLPSMGETDSKMSKLLLCHSFPYSWHFLQFSKTKLSIKESNGYPYLLQVFERIPYKDKKSWELVIRLKFLNGLEP
jgi:hypothetical protein